MGRRHGPCSWGTPRCTPEHIHTAHTCYVFVYAIQMTANVAGSHLDV